MLGAKSRFRNGRDCLTIYCWTLCLHWGDRESGGALTVTGSTFMALLESQCVGTCVVAQLAALLLVLYERLSSVGGGRCVKIRT